MSRNTITVKAHRWVVGLFVLGAFGLPVAAWIVASRVNGNSETLCVVIDAGRDTILAGALLPGDKPYGKGEPPVRVIPGELSRFLQPHGFPSYETRRQAAISAAARYESRIRKAAGGSFTAVCKSG